MAPITYLSLFSGAGGADLGLRIAEPRARCIGYVEITVEAAEILVTRIEEGSLDDAPVWSDVRTFPGDLYRGRVAGIVAGFPCPDYSVAGKRAGILGKHGQLWDDLAAVIRDVGPDWVLLENVAGILVSHRGKDGEGTLPAGLWYVLGDLASLGFSAQWLTLRASEVGASHGRNRWFCVAHRRGLADRNGTGYQAIDASAGDRGQDAVRGSDELGHSTSNDERRDSVPGEYRERVAVGRSGGSLGDTKNDHGRSGISGTQAGIRADGIGRQRSAGAIDALGDTDIPRLEGRQFSGRGLPNERAVRAAGDTQLALAGCLSGDRGTDIQTGDSNGGRTERSGEENGHAKRRSDDAGELPLFAPGPGAAELWQILLVRHPELRPAISQAETESIIHGMVTGAPGELDFEDRVDRLRSLGNLAQPLQVATAFTVLARRAGLKL